MQESSKTLHSAHINLPKEENEDRINEWNATRFYIWLSYFWMYPKLSVHKMVPTFHRSYEIKDDSVLLVLDRHFSHIKNIDISIFTWLQLKLMPSFCKCGLFPCNRHIFRQHEFLTTQDTEEEQASQPEIGNSNKGVAC